MTLPRLTGAIRAFGSIADRELLEADTSDDILRKRKACAEEEASQGLTWKLLSTTVQQYAESENKEEATKELRNLISVSRDIGICPCVCVCVCVWFQCWYNVGRKSKFIFVVFLVTISCDLSVTWS